MNDHSTDSVSQGADIIARAENVNLDPRVLYEAVIDLSSEGLITATCINMAAGILLNDLGLPNYFFKNIAKDSLKQILSSIASSITIKDGKVVLVGRVAHIDFDLTHGNNVQRVRIATRDTRDNMEKVLENLIPGHRRQYYFSPEKGYCTYIIRPETVQDYTKEEFKASKFLFNLAGDFNVTPEPTRSRYEKFLTLTQASVTPLVEVFNLPATGETRFMFDSDFAWPQLPIFRRLFEDHGLTLIRAYWEPYLDRSTVPASICSLYAQGELSRKKEADLLKDLLGFLSLCISPVTELYVHGELSFNEMLFAGNAIDFTNMFIFRESETATDREIMTRLTSKDHEDAFAARIHKSNKSTYNLRTIQSAVMENPDLLKFLYSLFENKFDPALAGKDQAINLEEKLNEFNRTVESRFIDYTIGQDIFKFMTKLITCTLKTNFYKPEKRSFSFRFDSCVLDPLVYNQFVFGVFFVNGHYSCGTHLRAGDIARGGLRLLRVTPSNHANEVDNSVLLNFALGPKGQRLKHKDICESGAKGVIVPHADYAAYGMDCLYDYTEGILDLMITDDSVVDYYGKPEMIFFGPDEGSAPFMDAISLQARHRGYPHWRTLTTGKSFGIPHDIYGILDNDDIFGLVETHEAGTDLQINGRSILTTTDMDKIHDLIGENIRTSGMTTTGIMGAFRTLISHYNAREEDLNLMMIGGPDGDLGANEIQTWRGKICLIVDGGSILFDPSGLDKKALKKIAFMRHSSPRENSMAFPVEKLSPQGFRVPRMSTKTTLPDGRVIENGAVFHKNFLFDPANRIYMEKANIQAFIPCGGFKDTVNRSNVKAFLENLKELRFIVEGANVFFSDSARRHIAAGTKIKHIKDTTANKGGVFSSSIGEVLTGFLMGEDYETKLLNDTATRWALIKDMLLLVEKFACDETNMLINIHKKYPEEALFALSEKTSEQIFALQALVEERLEDVLKQKALVWKVMEAYIPAILIKTLGKKQIMDIFDSDKMHAYRDAIITKKIASMAFYRFGLEWDLFLERVKADFSGALASVVEGSGQ